MKPKILLGIKSTGHLAGMDEFSRSIRGQETEIIFSGTEDEVRNYIQKQKEGKNVKQMEEQLYQHCEGPAGRRFSELYGGEAWEEEMYRMERMLHDATRIKKYDSVILIDGEIISI